jgi:hypothetical protein
VTLFPKFAQTDAVQTKIKTQKAVRSLHTKLKTFVLQKPWTSFHRSFQKYISCGQKKKNSKTESQQKGCQQRFSLLSGLVLSLSQTTVVTTFQTKKVSI